MKVTLIPSNEFSRQFKRLAKKYKSFGEDYLNLKKELMENPFRGDDLGGGVRKIRMAISSKGKGKRGGTRVLTLNVLVQETDSTTVTLLTIYDKGEIESVSDKFVKWLLEQR